MSKDPQTTRFNHTTFSENGAWGYAVIELYDDKPVLRLISGAHYGTEQTANLVGARVCERVRRVAEKYGMQEVAA